jgi:hypothetical protein
MLGPCLGADIPHQDQRIVMGGWAGKMRDKNRDVSVSKSKRKVRAHSTVPQPYHFKRLFWRRLALDGGFFTR